MSGPGKWVKGQWVPACEHADRAAVEFVEIARTVKITDETPQITYEGQSTFWKFCTGCHDQMQHIRKEDYSECAVCGNKSYKKEG